MKILLAVILCLLCGRPAFAEGTINVPSGSYYLSARTVVLDGVGFSLPDVVVTSIYDGIPVLQPIFRTGAYTGSIVTYSSVSSLRVYLRYTVGGSNLSNYVLSFVAQNICPSNSTGTLPTCTCGNGFEPNNDGNFCVVSPEPPPLSPNAQAAEDAEAAALAAGHSAAEALTAKNAVLAQSSAVPADWPGIGRSAAIAHEYADGLGVPAADAAAMGLATADLYAGATNLQPQERMAASGLMGGLAADRYAETAAAQSQSAASQELMASIAAAALTVGGAVAVAAGGPLTAAIGVSAMIHGAILQSELGVSNPLSSDAVEAVMRESLGSAANPLQVTLIAEAEFESLPSASTSAQVAESSAQVARVVTAPESDWDWSNVTAVTQHTAATTAASIANASVASGHTQSQTTQAVNSGVTAVTRGLTGDAASVAAAAAAAAIAAGYSKSQSQTAGSSAGTAFAGGATAGDAIASGLGSLQGLDGAATESTLQAVLDALKKPFDDPVGALGDVPVAETIPVENPEFDFVPVVFSSNDSCPADLTYMMVGRSYTLSYAHLCDWLLNIRPLFIAIAAMSAVFVFAGVKL